jgi:hypothetical protein
MRANQSVEGGSYGPEALEIIYQAFDEAWNSVAGNFGNDPEAIEAARLKLANIILSFPPDNIRSADQIKNSSLQIMALPYRMRPVHEAATAATAHDHQLAEPARAMVVPPQPSLLS